jgi:predicted Zn-dependent peptidase
MKIYFPDVKYYKIHDNFKLIYVNTKSNIFYSSINVNIGSINENIDQLGLAHFFEHMIFKGTKNKTSDEILDRLDSLGAQYNASTSYEETEYYISGNVKDYKIILEILLDLFLNPAFPQKDIANEINVVLEEFRMNEDNKNRKSINKLTEMLYNEVDNKFSVPVIGLPSNIINFTRDNLINFYNEKYLNAEKIISIIGSVEENKIINIIEKMFNVKIKTWKPHFIKLNPKLEIQFYNKKSTYKLELIKTPEIKQYIVNIGFRSINMYSKWCIVSNLLENILTGGMTSRLFVLLRNKLGLTYYQSSFNKTFKPHGFFCINYGVQPEGLEISLTHVLKELFEFSKSEISDDEIQKAKNMLETSILFNTETATDIGSYIINLVINKQNPLYIKKLDEKIVKINKEHIKQLASKIFKKSNMFIVINGSNELSFDKINGLIDII